MSDMYPAGILPFSIRPRLSHKLFSGSEKLQPVDTELQDRVSGVNISVQKNVARLLFTIIPCSETGTSHVRIPPGQS